MRHSHSFKIVMGKGKMPDDGHNYYALEVATAMYKAIWATTGSVHDDKSAREVGLSLSGCSEPRTGYSPGSIESCQTITGGNDGGTTCDTR